jgi:hypothetical protein
LNILKRIVSIDSSLAIGIKDGEFDLNTVFPRKDWYWTMQDSVFDEINFKSNEERAIFYIENEFYLQESFDIILLCEAMKHSKSDIRKILCSENTRNKFQQFLNKKRPNQNAEEFQYNNLLEERKNANHTEWWGRIPSSENKSGIITLSQDKIYKMISDLLKEDTIPIPLPSIISENIEIHVSSDSVFVMKGQNVIKDSAYEKLDIEFPLMHLFLVFECFKECLEKNKESKHKFTFSMNNDKIKIDINTLYDCRICLASLPYADKFATLDENQAKLIQQLFPLFKEKIYLIKP